MALTPTQQQEIDRLGQLWFQAKTQEEKTSLNQQANSIRQNAGLRAGIDYDPVSGTRLNLTSTSAPLPPGTKENVKRSPGGAVTAGGVVVNQPTEMQAAPMRMAQTSMAPAPTQVQMTDVPPQEPLQPEMSQSEQLLKTIMDLMNQSGAQQQALMAQLQQQAQTQAEAIAGAKRDGLTQLIDNLKLQQESGLRGIAGMVQDGEDSLEDKYFQNWLAARQGMANRGLAGSGLASDQDTRLLLQKQRDLSGIYRDAARNRFNLESNIGGQLNNAYKSLSGINTGDIAAQQFTELYKTGQSSLNNQAQVFADLFKTILPYDRAPIKDILGNELEWAKLGISQQNVELDKAKLLIEQGKVDLQTWQTYGYMPDPNGSGKLVPTTETSQFQQSQALREAQARGYFVADDGSIIPTEDRRHNMAIENLQGKELIARMGQWAQENSLAAQRINLNTQEFAHKMQYDQALLQKAEAELQASNDRTQLSGIRTQLSSVDGMIKSLLDQAEYNPAIKQSPEYLTLIQQRDGLMSSISSLFSAQ